MNDLAGKRVLFFSPRFFDYEKEIKRSLEELGAIVEWLDDRPSNNFTSKVLIRVNRKFLSNKIENYYNSTLKKMQSNNSKFDYILFLNPESIGINSLKAFKEYFRDAKFLLYMWDSFDNRQSTIELLPFFYAKFTFDPIDAEKYNLILRPLFYIDLYIQRQINNQLYDLLFVGTAHSDRYNFVNKIANQLHRKAKVKLFFFLSSKSLFWAKKVFDRNFKGIKYKNISFKSITHKDNAELVHMSKTILDIHHPKQIGLTMRTIEALGAQRKLITTNADVINYDFYDKRNILVIDRQNPTIPQDFLTQPFIPSRGDILKKYSIKGWISDLFV